jgi:FkbM family methyltransferase
MEKVFEKKYARADVFESILNWAIEKQLFRLSKKHLQNGRRQVVEFSFDLVSHRVNLDGIYEIKELSTLVDWLKEKDPSVFLGSAIDIGANIGNHSLFFSDLFEKVYSFEPAKITFDVLRLNSSLVNNIECFNVGISDVNGKASLMVPKGFLGCSRIITPSAVATQEIEIITLDSLLEKLPNIRLIKIDIEGHEYQALLGAKNVIRENMPYILFEQHRSEFDASGDTSVLKLLRTFGYTRFATVREYPRLGKSEIGFFKYIYLAMVRLIFGSKMKIVTGEVLEPEFYSFIIAVPD